MSFKCYKGPKCNNRFGPNVITFMAERLKMV